MHGNVLFSRGFIVLLFSKHIFREEGGGGEEPFNRVSRDDS